MCIFEVLANGPVLPFTSLLILLIISLALDCENFHVRDQRCDGGIFSLMGFFPSETMDVVF